MFEEAVLTLYFLFFPPCQLSPYADFEDLEFEPTLYSVLVERLSSSLGSICVAPAGISLGTTLKVFGLLAFNTYLAAAAWIHLLKKKESPTELNCCNGVGFLLFITFVAYFYNFVTKLVIPGIPNFLLAVCVFICQK